MVRVTQEEIIASIIQPHFDEVRNTFADFVPDGDDRPMAKLRKVKFVVDPEIHNTPRHFAATRDDGLLMLFAPQIVDLPAETLVAILMHEFGHAADFSYPARWITPGERAGGKGDWIPSSGEELKEFRQWKKIWQTRSRDQVEWAADSISYRVTGLKLGYAGDCLLQSFLGGKPRPKGLR